MKIRDWFKNWNITGLKLNTGFLNFEWDIESVEKQAAWELYIELVTRITTQPLADSEGDEATALESVRNIFSITRELLKAKGRKAITFSKIAVVILNQKVRPFTAPWHKRKLDGDLETAEGCKQFRADLKEVQLVLQHYAGMLAAIAEVEDIQALDDGPLESI